MRTRGIKTTAVAMRLIMGMGSRSDYSESGVASGAGVCRAALGLDRETPRPHTTRSTLGLVVRPVLCVLGGMPARPQPAITAVAFLIFLDAFEQLHAAEIRPQRRRHIDLRIGQLPEQEVTQPHLSAGANY